MHSKSGAGREHRENLGSGKAAVKKHSNRVPPGGSQSVSAHNQSVDNVTGLSQQHLSMIQNQSNQALIDSTIGAHHTGSPKSSAPHLNVYKPTFIINNSFQNEQQVADELQNNGIPGSRGSNPSTADINKKYSRQSAKQAPSSSQQPIGPSSSSQQMMAHSVHVGSQNSSSMHKLGSSNPNGYPQQNQVIQNSISSQ